MYGVTPVLVFLGVPRHAEKCLGSVGLFSPRGGLNLNRPEIEMLLLGKAGQSILKLELLRARYFYMFRTSLYCMKNLRLAACCYTSIYT